MTGQRYHMRKFIRVQSPKFAILPGEAEELVNEGMYGKALAEYLAGKLDERGYKVPFTCCEDWGWWVELAGFSFKFGVCVYGTEIEGGELDLYVTDGAISERQWSWRKFRYVSTTDVIVRLHSDLVSIFENDVDVEILGTDLDSLVDDPRT